jgi:hypothetical protein
VTPTYFAALLLFNQLTDFPCWFACASSYEMDQDSYPKLNASLCKTHLKRTVNLLLPKLLHATAEAEEEGKAAWCCKLEQTSLQS